MAATTTAVVDKAATSFDPVIDIEITVRDAFGNLTLRASENVTATAVFGAERRAIPLSYASNGGVYAGAFRPWKYGQFQIEITVDGAAIPGSPFPVVRSLF